MAVPQRLAEGIAKFALRGLDDGLLWSCGEESDEGGVSSAMMWPKLRQR